MGDDKSTAIYTEHEKLAKVKDQSQAICEFVEEFLPAKDLFIGEARRLPGGKRSEYNSDPAHVDVQALVAEFLGIDQVKLEQEKRAMVDALRGGGR